MKDVLGVGRSRQIKVSIMNTDANMCKRGERRRRNQKPVRLPTVKGPGMVAAAWQGGGLQMRGGDQAEAQVLWLDTR